MSLRNIVLGIVLIFLALSVGCASLPITQKLILASVTPVPVGATPISPIPTHVPPTPTIGLTAIGTTLLPLSGSGGGRIAFSSRRDGNYEIYVMNADGTDPRRLTMSPGNEEGDPAWSPDGTQIAFSSSRESQGTILVMNADGTNLQQLSSRGGMGPAWSPDGARIAFSCEIHGSDLYVMNSDGTHEQQLTFTDVPGSKTLIFSPAWSPDGTQIACVVDFNPDKKMFGETTIHLFNLGSILPGEGDDIAHMHPLPRPGSPFNDDPAWSPDGKQIAFSAVIHGHREIYVIDADGKNLRQLTQSEHFDELAPAWSPDGTQIVFQANTEGQWDIFVMNADSSNLRRLTTDTSSDVDPDWSP
jgi:TolB protein